MILPAWRLLRALSLPQYIGILLTVLLPVLPVSVLNLTTTTLLIIYALWSPCAILIIAAVFREQRVDVDQRISEKVGEVMDQLRGLENRQDESAAIISGVAQQVDEVDQVMRNAFEELVVGLPSRRYYAHLSVSSLEIQASSPTAKVGGGSRMDRFWRWVKAQAHRIRRIVWDLG